MPIRPERKQLYPKSWPAISKAIRERAGQKCEQCAAANGSLLCRGIGSDAGTYMLERGEVHDASTGERLGLARGSEYAGRIVKIILTVAHLNHDPSDCRDENLRALCQRCHLNYDRDDKTRRRRERERLSVAVADMFG